MRFWRGFFKTVGYTGLFSLSTVGNTAGIVNLILVTETFFSPEFLFPPIAKAPNATSIPDLLPSSVEAVRATSNSTSCIGYFLFLIVAWL